MQFHRYLSKGNNINKLHNKIQNGRTGTHLFSIKSAQILTYQNNFPSHQKWIIKVRFY